GLADGRGGPRARRRDRHHERRSDGARPAPRVDGARSVHVGRAGGRRRDRRPRLRAGRRGRQGHGQPPHVTDRPIRVLALSPIPEEGAGCRFRIAQFIPYLESVGFEVTLQSLFTPEFFRLVYRRGQYLRKAIGFAGLSLKRLGALTAAGQFDVILLYRE